MAAWEAAASVGFLYVGGVDNFADLQMSQRDGDTVIDLQTYGTITLLGVGISDLVADDFIF